MRVVWSERSCSHQLVESVPTDATLGAFLLLQHFATQPDVASPRYSVTKQRVYLRSLAWLRTIVSVAAVWFGLAGATQAQSNSWISTAALGSQLALTWSNTDSTANGFLIERSTDATNFNEIVRVPSNSTNYQDNGLAPSTLYYYRLRAYNSAGVSDYSNLASTTTSTSAVAPTLLDGYWDDGMRWSLGHPPAAADSSNSITNSPGKTVTADFFTAAMFSNTLTISNLTLSAPPGSTNTLFLNSMNDSGSLRPLEILKQFTVGNGGVLLITNSALQVDGLSGGSFSIDGTVTMFDGLIVTTNARIAVGNQSTGSFAIYGGTINARDITVGAGASGVLIVSNGAITASSITVTNSAGAFIFNAGTINSAGTTISNGFVFLLDSGVFPAHYHLLGGVHTFANGMFVRNKSVLSGCGTVNGDIIVRPGGTVLADCGGTLTFTGIVTNRGIMRAVNGSVLESYGPLVNDPMGVLIIISGSTNFHSTFINNGTVLNSGGTNNSWISPTSGQWESATNWSQGVAPFDELSVFITNANNKTVTIDATTNTNAPTTMTISNLVLSAPSGSTNTLLLDNVGTGLTPLQVLSNFIADVNGTVVVSNSTLIATNCIIGNSGAGNHLILAVSGQLHCFNGDLGNNLAAGNNTVLVTDPGSFLDCNNLRVGVAGSGNSLVICNTGVLGTANTILGDLASSSNNTISVTGGGSVWFNDLAITVGNFGSGNSLVISNGGVVGSATGIVGDAAGSSNNMVLVTGDGSIWNNYLDLAVGNHGSSNGLAISDGGVVGSGTGTIGGGAGSNNTVLVTGDRSVWSVGGLSVGSGPSSFGNTVAITNGGSVVVDSNLLIGSSSMSNRVNISTSSSTLLIGGTLSISPSNTFGFSSGFVRSAGTAITNGQTFVVGDGTSEATFNLDGGVHSFANGLEIRSSADLSGCGTINGNVTVDAGGTVKADCGGTLNFTGTVINNGAIVTFNGTFIDFHGPVINNASLVATNKGVRFRDGIIGNGTLILDPKSDADGDDVPNGWTQQYFGHPLGLASDKSRGQDDASGTGQTNLFKYVAGLNPTNRASIFSFNVAAVPNQPNQEKVIFGPIAPGRTYTPQFTTDLASGLWSELTGSVTNGDQVTIIDTNVVEPQKFYRVRIRFDEFTSSNSHGVPNWWLMQYNLPVDDSGAGADTDGDGQINAAEYLFGTVPTNSASVCRIIAIVKQGNDLRVTWTTVGGKKYQPQAGNGGNGGNFTTGNFADIGPLITMPSGGESTTNYVDIGGATNSPARYYRVRPVP
jgi:T5SS/PEP-CTERM-associated repeat protein